MTAGLGPFTTWLSIIVAIVAALLAYFTTVDPERASLTQPNAGSRYRWIPFWFMVGCFTFFAVRSFCWLLYIDGPEFRIQSVNNLGDLALHVTYIRTFANGVPLWPDNPIYVFSHLRYPAGVDLFNGLLSVVNIDLIRGLVWVGLLASVATFYAFYRWGGLFAIAGFLFNGGVVGFEFLTNFDFKDYQGQNTIAWKSIPLSMFVTQRGLLYAIPAGLLLLWHWREKFYRLTKVDATSGRAGESGEDAASTVSVASTGPLPFWAELLIYCSMPLFHVHTFLALSGVLVFLFLLGDAKQRLYTGRLVGAAVIPATFFVWMITDHFGAKSMIKWQPGWVQSIGDFAHPLGGPTHPATGGGFLRRLDPVVEFWVFNFGLWIPLVLGWCGMVAARTWRGLSTTSPPGRPAIPIEVIPTVLTIILLSILAPCFTSWWYLLLLPVLAIPGTLLVYSKAKGQRLPVSMDLVFMCAAVALFLFGYLFKTAPWEWDNLKLMFWGYFIVLPFLWNGLISDWRLPLRIVACVVLFGSGFVSLFGGLSVPGYGFANRAEVAGVGVAVRKLPLGARFATYPTFNHPVLLQGRKVVLGYPGHLWTQGFDYHEEEAKLNRLMRGEADWRQAAQALRVRYIFWGREENTNYPNSTHPWESVLAKVASGPWGAIYDLNQPKTGS